MQGVYAAITDVIEQEFSATKAPGMAYAVVQEGNIRDIGVKGVLDNRQAMRVTEDSLFIIGSVSKSFTALAIMQLVEDGSLILDMPISQTLKNFAGTPLSDVTIRQLLSHTSGLSTVQGNQSQTDYAIDADALKRRVERLQEIRPAIEPGTKWKYSNANYQILGRIIEVTSGMNYAKYIEQNILKPTGMNDSFVFSGETFENMANGHRPWFFAKRALRKNKTGLGSAPQGGVVSSANEMALYMAMMMNGEDDIISAEGKQQMMTSASKASTNYGFGWFLNSEQGLVFHSGANPGYEALVTMHPQRKEAAVVLVNAGSGYGFGETLQLRYGVVAAALNIPYAGELGMTSKKATFIFLAILPFVLLFGIFRTWRKPNAVKLKAGFLSQVALYLPLVFALCLSWALIRTLPTLFGATFSAANVFQPDMGLLLATVSILAVFWAGLRIVLVIK